MPAVISVALGVYVAFGALADGANVPVPVLDQLMPLATANVPFSETTGLLAQTVASNPASTVGASVMVTIIWSFIDAHAPLFDEVNVNVTVPAAVSAALGVYVAFSVVAEGANAPLPVVVQMPLPVEEDPFSVTTALFAQTV